MPSGTGQGPAKRRRGGGEEEDVALRKFQKAPGTFARGFYFGSFGRADARISQRVSPTKSPSPVDRRTSETRTQRKGTDICLRNLSPTAATWRAAPLSEAHRPSPCNQSILAWKSFACGRHHFSNYDAQTRRRLCATQHMVMSQRRVTACVPATRRRTFRLVLAAGHGRMFALAPAAR